ncbi:MAG: sterol desaturase family protein [Emcibacteraceae bacterium]
MIFKKLIAACSLIAFPTAFIVTYFLKVYEIGYSLRVLIPGLIFMLTLLSMFILEQLYHYKNAVSQRRVLTRDIASTILNGFYTSSILHGLLGPSILFLPNMIFGRDVIFNSSDKLGPFWLQLILVFFFYSFIRYAVHRLQHTIPFLWELHSYHHSVTDIRMLNLFVSHPFDYGLRNVLPGMILGLVGFDEGAVFFSAGLLSTASIFSHCGSGAPSGKLLNSIFMTPEVHRWHHSTVTPEGHKYAVNYGVGLNLWDKILGTYYMPEKDGIPVPPDHMGHPEGLPDEPNYLKILFLTRYWPKFLKTMVAGKEG